MSLKWKMVGSLAVVLFLVGCGGGSSTAISNSVTVADGPVLNAKVIDASGQVATANGNVYTFANTIVYPVIVQNGFVDMDESGNWSEGDYYLPKVMKAKEGNIVTPATTLISDLNDVQTETLLNSLGLNKDDLKKLPSEKKEIALLSHLVMNYMVDNNITDATEVNTTNFTLSIDPTDVDLSTKEYAHKIEKARKEALEAKGAIVPFIKDGFELSIAHVNDTHSHIDTESMTLKFDGLSVKAKIGGYPRVVSKIKSIQEEHNNTLALNAGDTFQGTLYYSLFKGTADAEVLNQVFWDALELGNHEFDDGDQSLADYLDLLDINESKVLAANVVAPSGNVLYDKWSPYTIKTFANGEKVGIIGIDTAGKTKNSSNPSDEIVFNNEVTTAQTYIDTLRNQGINKIVLLTHVGLTSDKAYAKELDGVDIIIGGDSHSLMGDFKNVGLVSEDNSYPYMTADKNGSRVCIGHAWQYAYAVGNMDIVFDENGTVKGCKGETTLLVGDSFTVDDEDVNESAKAQILSVINQNANIEIVTEDNATKEIVSTYASQVDTKKAVVLGSASERLGHNRIPGDKKDGVVVLPLGSDIAPVVAKAFYDLSNLSDASIQNAGGVRVAIEQGDVTMGDAYTLLPFANTLYEIKMTGAEVKAVLEDAVDEALYGGIDGTISTGSFPYAYGLRYDVNGDANKSSRILNLEIVDRATKVWSDINATKLYTIVTNSYTAGGKDEYHTFKTAQENNGEGVDTYLDYAMSFVKYVENLEANGATLSKLPQEEHCIKSFSYNKVLKKIGTFNTTKSGGAEIVAYDATSEQIYVTNAADNTLDIIDISTPSTPTKVISVDMSSYGTGINSVTVKNGKVAIAVEIKNEMFKNSNGKVVIFDTDGNYEKNVTVGFLPDMVTFNEDGTKVIVANEGEPWVDMNGDYQDVAGSIGVVTVLDGSYVDINFSTATLSDAADGTKVRIKPDSTKDVDLEPEYITVKGGFAYVTLQENNAIAKVDLSNNTLVYVKSFGAKSYEANSGNTIDIEENGKIEMKSFPGLFSLYMPDTISSYTVGSDTYMVTANEGDGREYPIDDDINGSGVDTGDAWTDEKKISKLDLDSSIADAYADDNDLKVMIDLGSNTTDGKGIYTKLYTYGGRSFSIWNSDGELIWDSKDEFSKKIAQLEPMIFNQDEGEMDGRSGNKGVEPEALTIGTIGDKTYAFVGLERQNGVMIYDITIPTAPIFVDYVSIQKTAGDIAPEGMVFIPASESPNGKNLLIIASEGSGTTTIYEINL